MAELLTASETWVEDPTDMPDGGQERYSQQESSVPSEPFSAGDWLSKIRREVYAHREVEDLYVSIGDEELVDYWIIIPQRDLELVGRLIEDQYARIIIPFAETGRPPFGLDFHIIYLEGRDPEDLVPRRAIRVPNFSQL